MNREEGLFRLAVVLFPVFGIVGVVVIRLLEKLYIHTFRT